MRIDKSLKEKAFSLRLLGYGYSKIQRTLGLKSKGTLSLWFRDLVLTEKAKSLLEKNNRLAHDRGLFAFNTRRTKSVIIENKKFTDDGVNLIGKLDHKSLLLVGIILYWAEGTKSEKCNQGLSFSNSDPVMIAHFVQFLKESLKIEAEKITGGIHIYPDSDVEQAKKYWSKITSIPEKRFYIITQVSLASRGKRPYNKLPYGTAVIRVSGRKYFYLMKGMIEGVKSKFK